jgi:hypothetical protein
MYQSFAESLFVLQVRSMIWCPLYLPNDRLSKSAWAREHTKWVACSGHINRANLQSDHQSLTCMISKGCFWPTCALPLWSNVSAYDYELVRRSEACALCGRSISPTRGLLQAMNKHALRWRDGRGLTVHLAWSRRHFMIWSVKIMGVECSGCINGTLVAPPGSAALAFLREVRRVWTSCIFWVFVDWDNGVNQTPRWKCNLGHLPLSDTTIYV